MATENATECHTTANEEEATLITMDPIIVDLMRAPRMNSVTYYIRGGLEKVQMNETLMIFLGKRYGSVVVHIQSY
jgi:hypothetical protein